MINIRKSSLFRATDGIGTILLFFAFFIATFGAWVRHIFWTVSTLAGEEGVTVGQGVLAILGAVFPPLGVIHGWSLWLGYAWQ